MLKKAKKNKMRHLVYPLILITKVKFLILMKNLNKKIYEMKELITNLSGPIKTRFLSVDIVAQGVASDFEKIMEENDHRIRHEALKVMGSYDYEESQSNAFMERVNVDLLKRFASVLQKYSRGDSNVITNLYFTEFVIQ